jgi:hypothetical protein
MFFPRLHSEKVVLAGQLSNRILTDKCLKPALSRHVYAYKYCLCVIANLIYEQFIRVIGLSQG